MVLQAKEMQRRAGAFVDVTERLSQSGDARATVYKVLCHPRDFIGSYEKALSTANERRDYDIVKKLEEFQLA